LAKGFKDSSGKFHPTGNNSTSSRQKSVRPEGVKITSGLSLPKELDLDALNNDMRDIADEIDFEIHNNTRNSIPSQTRINVVKDKLEEIEETDENIGIRSVPFNPVPELKDLGIDVTKEDHKKFVHVGKLIEEISEDSEPISENAKDAGRLVGMLLDERGSLGEILGSVSNELIELQTNFSNNFKRNNVDVEPDLTEMFGVLTSLTLIAENLNANGSELNHNVVSLSQGYTTRSKVGIARNLDQIAESFQTLLSKSDELSVIANRLYKNIEDNFDLEAFEIKFEVERELK